jgi:hypothetical protein
LLEPIAIVHPVPLAIVRRVYVAPGLIGTSARGLEPG